MQPQERNFHAGFNNVLTQCEHDTCQITSKSNNKELEHVFGASARKNSKVRFSQGKRMNVDMDGCLDGWMDEKGSG